MKKQDKPQISFWTGKKAKSIITGALTYLIKHDT